jgi:hypothetical protein
MIYARYSWSMPGIPEIYHMLMEHASYSWKKADIPGLY